MNRRAVFYAGFRINNLVTICIDYVAFMYSSTFQKVTVTDHGVSGTLYSLAKQGSVGKFLDLYVHIYTSPTLNVSLNNSLSTGAQK